MFAAPDSAVGYIYIPDTLSGSSRLLIKKVYNDTTAPVTVATISLPGQPLGVATSPDGEKVYVAVSGATQSIKVYSKDGVADTVLPTITNGAFRALRGLAVAPDGKRLYAADSLANKVHVIDTVGGTVLTSIDVPVASDVYGVAVSPDNALLAVTRKTTSGSLFVYRIDRELDGTISYDQLWSQSGLYYPNYPIFSPDSKRLYVRVHELSGSFNDVYVYENPNRPTAPTPQSIRVPYDIATSEAYTGNNRGGEAMTLSSNGQYLYFIHFRVWNTVAKPVEAHFYRVNNLNTDGSSRTVYSDYPRTDLNEGLMYSTTPGTPTPYDGMAASPDGSRVWYSCSEGGSYSSLRFTGFTTYPGGVLTNAIPGAPGIVHPASASGDDLNNYTSGAVQWTNGVDDSTGPYHFEVSYKRTTASTWTTPTDWAWLDGSTHNVTLPTSLSYNSWYVVQVRMHDGTYWSDPAFSELFKKSFPTITSIEVDTDRGTGSTWQGFDFTNNIGYIYDTIKLKGSGFGTVISPWTNGAGEHNQIQFGIPDKFGNYYYEVIPGQEGTNHRIISWADNEIIMIIPRKFKSGDVFKADPVRVKVKANDLLSTFRPFKVGAVITEMSPRSGLAGDAMVTITGSGFGGVTGTDDVIFFDNQLTTITSRVTGADYDQFVVPVPATATTGRVIVRANSIDSSANYQGSPHGSYNEPVIFTVTGVAVQNVAVTSPNGGETLTAGSTANITWTSSGITNVKIRYSANGGLHWADVVTSTPAAAGTFTWTPVPSTPTTQGRVEVSDAGDSSPLDTSDANFTIQSGGTGPQVLIDDFEGGSVDPATGYYAPFGTNPPSRTRQSTVVDSGSYAMQALYSWTGGDPLVNWGGGWGADLRTPQNIGITGLDRVRFRVRGDAALNATTYFIQVVATDNIAYRSPTKTLPATTSWSTEEATYSQMWNDVDNDGAVDAGEGYFSARADKTIKGYAIVYNGHNTTPITANHYIDNIVATTSGIIINPDVPRNLRAAKSGSDVALTWDVPSGGEPTTGYQIYTGTSASTITTPLGAIIPSGAHASTHTGAVTDAGSHYYVVKGVNGATESGPSNVAFILKQNLVYSADRGNIFWISIPYIIPYTNAQDIVNDINGRPTPGTVTQIGRWNPDTQLYETYDWLAEPLNMWSGTNFTPVEGEALFVNINANTTVGLTGAHDPAYAFNLTQVVGRGNIFWISLPYATTYSNAQAVEESINGAPTPGAVNQIGRWNGDTQLYETYDWLAEPLNMWSGTNFTVNPLEGYFINLQQNVTGWRPATL
jgi:YVTN family beta-propeller protein